MEQYYTVNSAKRLDGQDTYGNVTDSVFFKEHQGSVMWKHAPNTQVTEGTKVYGQIETLTSQAGKEYSKFTKKQVPEGVGTSANGVTPSVSTGNSDGFDGAKRGMAINNAAAYVTALSVSRGELLTPEEFGEQVGSYAKQIYKIDPVAKNESDELLDFLNA